MKNKKVFFQACDRIYHNENFDWSTFYHKKEWELLDNPNPNLCGTTGCLMHEYPKISSKFCYTDVGIGYKEAQACNNSTAFGHYHNVEDALADSIVYKDYSSFNELVQKYGLDKTPHYLHAKRIAKRSILGVKAPQAIFYFLFLLIGSGNLNPKDIPQNLLEIYVSVTN